MTIEEYVISYLSEALNPEEPEEETEPAPVLRSDPDPDPDPDPAPDPTPPTPLSVTGSVPHPLPDEFVTVELTGERVTNLVPTASIHINGYSTSRAAAAALGRQIYAAMAALPQQPEISRCALTSMYNDTDLEINKPSEAAIFEIVYLFMEEEENA